MCDSNSKFDNAVISVFDCVKDNYLFEIKTPFTEARFSQDMTTALTVMFRGYDVLVTTDINTEEIECKISLEFEGKSVYSRILKVTFEKERV